MVISLYHLQIIDKDKAKFTTLLLRALHLRA